MCLQNGKYKIILQKQIPLANSSATRNLILKGWLDNRINWKTTWLHYYLDILIMACPLARLHKARAATVLNIVEFIKGGLLVALLATS